MPQEKLRSKLIRVAYQHHELRAHLLPLLKSAGEFEDAIENRTFKSDATNRDVKFKSLPSEQQKKIREEWTKKKDSKSVKLTDEHREALAEYDLDIVGDDVAQAIEIAKKIKEGIESSADICQMSPSVCKGNKGLTRDKMPQIEGDKTLQQLQSSKDPADKRKAEAMIAAGADPDVKQPIMQQLVDHLSKKGVKTKKKRTPVGMLKATQKEIKAEKVYALANNYLKGKFPDIDDSVIVSRDGHLLDGHHRWAALLLIDPKHEMNVKVVDMDIDELLEQADAFPGVYKADIKGTPLPDEKQKKSNLASTQTRHKQTYIEDQFIRLAHSQTNRAPFSPILRIINNERRVRQFFSV